MLRMALQDLPQDKYRHKVHNDTPATRKEYFHSRLHSMQKRIPCFKKDKV